jgi:hypothetical protein
MITKEGWLADGRLLREIEIFCLFPFLCVFEIPCQETPKNASAF